MKKFAKRTVALVLTLVMAVGMLTVGASAAAWGNGGEGMPEWLIEQLDPTIPEIREGVKHVACIGDSVTYGSGVMRPNLDRGSTYPALLETELGENYQVLNYGFSGKTLLKEGDQPYTEAKFYDISHEAGADIYIIMLGTNDSKPYNWNAELYREELGEFVRSYMELPNEPQIYLLTPPRAFILDGAEEEQYNIKNDTIRDETAPIVKEVAELLGVTLIDMYKETENHPEWFPDGIHPNAAGNAEFAKIIAEYLKDDEDAASPGGGGGMPPFVSELLNPTTPEIREGVKHIACIGDSITWGHGVMIPNLDFKSTYPAFLEAALGEGYQVLNYGISSKTLLKEGNQPYIETKFYDISHEAAADTYIIMLGTNDSKPDNWNAKLYREELEEFVRSYMELPNEPQIYLLTPPRAFILDGAEEEQYNIKNDTIRDEAAPIVKEVAELLDVNLIDMYKETENHPEWFPEDGVHPGAAGNVEFAKIIAGYLKANESGSFFTDTATSPYVHYIDALAEVGIFSGTGNGKFSPDIEVTRAMAVTVLSRLAEVEGTFTNSFTDVPADEWYTNAVGWAVENGIVTDDGSGKFNPNAAITGKELDVMLYSFAKTADITYTASSRSAAALTRAELAGMVYFVYSSMEPTLPTYYSDYQVAQSVAYIDGGDELHSLDVYDPAPGATLPLIIEIHGGGFINPTSNKETNLMHSDYYAKNGFKVVTPNYTLMPAGNFKTIAQDLFNVFEWVRQHADEYNFDLDQVFLSGDSAGGYIVTLLAAILNTPELQEYYELTPPTDITFKGFVVTCPMADLEDLVRVLDGTPSDNFLNNLFAQKIGAGILKDEDIMSHAILFDIIDPKFFPEVYIITTPDGGDPYYREAKMLHDFLETNGIAHEYREYSKIVNSLDHVFNVNKDHIKDGWIESRMANDAAIAYMLRLCN